jgi:hypothetical protein
LPGQTGVDAKWLGNAAESPFGPGITNAELKPSSLSGMNKALSQIQNWGTQGTTAIFTYSDAGIFSSSWFIW